MSRYGYGYRYERDGINNVRYIESDVNTIDFLAIILLVSMLFEYCISYICRAN